MWSSFFALWFGLLCLQRLSLGKHRPSDLSWVNFGAVGITGLSSPWNKHSIVGTKRSKKRKVEISIREKGGPQEFFFDFPSLITNNGRKRRQEGGGGVQIKDGNFHLFFF